MKKKKLSEQTEIKKLPRWNPVLLWFFNWHETHLFYFFQYKLHQKEHGIYEASEFE